MERERITHFTAVPTMLIMLLSYKYYDNYDYSSQKNTLYGGGKMPSTVIKTLNDKYYSINFCQTYGQTE